MNWLPSLRLVRGPCHRMNRCLTTVSQDHPVWSLGILNHVAIATPNIDQAASFYKNVLRAKVSEKVASEEGLVVSVRRFLNTVCIPSLSTWEIQNWNYASPRIHCSSLVEPYGESSPISNFLAKNKNGGMHHICIEVDNVTAAVEDLKQKGVRALDPKPKIGAHGLPVVFLHPKDCGGVLVELEEKKS